MNECRGCLEVPGGTIDYLDEGEGPAVVLLHGFPCTSYLWRAFLPLLTGRFRVIAPDLPGSGGSIASPDASLDLVSQTEAVASLMEQLDLGRCAIAGHGVGAAIAQRLAVHDLGVDAMVLLDATDAVPPSQESEEADRSIRATFQAGMRDRALPEPVLDRYLEPFRGDEGARRYARVRAGLEAWTPARPDLSGIGFPVLILWGEEDPVASLDEADRLNEAMPSSTLGLLPGCGHYLPEEAPETIGPMIAEYLRARFLLEPHGHDEKEGVVLLQLERRPPWLDLAEDEEDDWFDVEDQDQDKDQDQDEGGA